MLASLFNVCEDRVIPHIFAEFLIFIALSSKARVMMQISSLVSVIVLSIASKCLAWGGALAPWGRCPLISPSYYFVLSLISNTQCNNPNWLLLLQSLANVSASSHLSNCPTTSGVKLLR